MRPWTWLCWSLLSASLSAQGSTFGLRFFGTGAGQQDRIRIAVDDDAPGPDASASIDLGRGDFSISLWVRGTIPDNPTAHSGGDREFADDRWREGNVLLDRGIDSGSLREFGVSLAGGFVRFGTGVDPAFGGTAHTLEGDTLVLDDQWHRITVVRTATTGAKSIFVDGALDVTSALWVALGDLSYPDEGVATPHSPWSPYLVVAAEKNDAPGSHAFRGWLDELCLYDEARSPADVAADFGRVVPRSQPGLVGYYRFEEGTGVTLHDTSLATAPPAELRAGHPGEGEWTVASKDAASVAPLAGGFPPPGFQVTTLTNDLLEPMVMEFLPDGRLLIGQRNGTIRLFEDGQLSGVPVVTLSTNVEQGERGLSGLAAAPDFATSGRFYAFHTTPEPRNRVSHFTLVGDTADPLSEQIVWESPDLAQPYHHGGCIGFGGDGRLYVSTGDQFFGPYAQMLHESHGKLLRMEPDGAVPVDNPFLMAFGADPLIYALGLRNPFRFHFDPTLGTLWIGDVGGNNATSWEEINRGLKGKNYGWPYQEGEECFLSSCGAFRKPVFAYQHLDPEYHEGSIQGAIILGPVYRGSTFPAAFQGNLFFGDYANRSLRRLVLDAEQEPAGDAVFLAAPDAGTLVDLKVGPDGTLYFLTLGVPWSGAPDAPGLHRIEALPGGNQAPVAVATATFAPGPAPLQVAFQGGLSFDPDDGPAQLAYDWDFGDGSFSTEADPVHTYAERGQYQARLSVRDGAASHTAAALPIEVGHAPEVTILSPHAGLRYRGGDPISFAGEAIDEEDGVLPAAAYTWQVLLVHGAHSHPFLGPLPGITSGSFVIPATDHPPEDTSFEVVLQVLDSDGLGATARVGIDGVSSFLRFTTEPAGIPILLDGQPFGTPRLYESLPFFQHQLEALDLFELDGEMYAFSHWSDGGPANHLFVTPDTAAGRPAIGRLHATYRRASESIVDRALAGAEACAQSSDPGSVQLRHDIEKTAVWTGHDLTTAYQAGLQFAVPAPPGACIVEAWVELTAGDFQQGDPAISIRTFDAASAAAFEAGAPGPLTDLQPLVSLSVPWSPPPFVPGRTYCTPELKELLQAVVDRPDWQADGTVAILLDGSGSAPMNRRSIRNFASGQPAVLHLRYATASSP